MVREQPYITYNINANEEIMDAKYSNPRGFKHKLNANKSINNIWL